jgi:hypothetical protein
LNLLKIFSHYPGWHKKMNLHSGMKDPGKPYSRARLVVKAKIKAGHRGTKAESFTLPFRGFEDERPEAGRAEERNPTKIEWSDFAGLNPT